MKLVIAFVAIAMCSAVYALTETEINEKWEKFKVDFNRNYDETEEPKRKQIFTENLKRIDEHNKKYEQGLVTYTMGLNMFADMTEEEKRPYSHGVLRPKTEN